MTSARIGQSGDVHPGVAQDLTAERVEGTHRDGATRHALVFQRCIQPFPEFLRGASVERDRAYGPGVGTHRDAPADAGDESGGLARPGRGDAQHRSRGCDGCRSLIGCQPGQPLPNRVRQCLQGMHRTMMGSEPYRGLIRVPGCRAGATALAARTAAGQQPVSR